MVLKVCMIGSGNFASALVINVGDNVKANPETFDPIVNMWVFEEDINGRKLTEIINEEHENVKYLPGIKLPSNVKAVPDVLEAAEGADIYIFCLPHQFVSKSCSVLKSQVKAGAIGISLIKGFQIKDGELILMSEEISNMLNGMPVSVLMGANLATEIAEGKFCESTIGCKSYENGKTFRSLFQTNIFRTQIVEGDRITVEMCGGLKNIIAVGAGFSDGMKMGNNTKAAIIRMGIMEMIEFVKLYEPNTQISTYLESCGVADIMTTAYGGRNRALSEEFAKQYPNNSFEDLEKEMLNGQKLQGPLTAKEVANVIKTKKLEKKFPLFVTINAICEKEIPPQDLLESVQFTTYKFVK
ncbi:glycerol-3-phosphate dehydrogenase [NAD(+)], cytoplasmic [Lepeophtheirus salmonis]|uniref:Glycerol-3-phosphate dehydrogenase [NAD(+)] n=1 Tax=Lepeophtheirus salmonis TaxID=72036 RepID=C1BTR9_LEPSM|nr:glycerol-3-phosphate dehydrogenase [NAD(+)], cytoplasmic-like isoform X1 [Lepeophtheirus salmonis]ACO12422.1 Glycerol-3-phosphate dehydrogenase, cytoplasmic [Lepeophtheirus salmonis]ADD38490.1 Glycerol-3-phosphate dehydrogenase, cytoplasmic [Lepeophtheirus salmonis]